MEQFPKKKVKLPYESIMRATYGLHTKDNNTQIYVLCLAKGVKQQRLSGGNPILFLFLLFWFCFALSFSQPLLEKFLKFLLVFVPSKTFGMVYGVCDLILLKNRYFCSQSRNFVNSLERAFDLKFLQKIDIQISLIFLIFQNVWSYISIRSLQIATDFSVLDRFCFLCIVCLF